MGYYDEYLEHSAKGSHWSKKNHKYYKKVKSAKTGKWIYYYKINGKDIGLVDETADLGDGRDQLSKVDEKFFDQYAERLKTLDLLDDGNYLKNDEKRYISSPGLKRTASINSYDDDGAWKKGIDYKKARQKVAKELLSAGSPNDYLLDFSDKRFTNVSKPTAKTIKESNIEKKSPLVNKATTNDYYRDMYYKDNQKALAKGIKNIKKKRKED